MSLYDFRRRVATALLSGALPVCSSGTQEVSTGTQEEEEDGTEEPSTSRRRQQKDVPPEIRFNGMEHLPAYAEKKLHCKITDCTFKTFWFCSRCKVHLCIAKDRVCFTKYHTLN